MQSHRENTVQLGNWAISLHFFQLHVARCFRVAAAAIQSVLQWPNEKIPNKRKVKQQFWTEHDWNGGTCACDDNSGKKNTRQGSRASAALRLDFKYRKYCFTTKLISPLNVMRCHFHLIAQSSQHHPPTRTPAKTPDTWISSIRHKMAFAKIELCIPYLYGLSHFICFAEHSKYQFKF